MAAKVALPNLPYPPDAFGDLYSAKAFSFHHGKHHKAYVDKCLELIKGTPMEGKTVGEIIKASDGVLFNQAAQIFNHSFFWECMTPGGGGAPPANSKIAQQITKDFGSVDKMVAEFGTKAAGNFGSGWTWLVWSKGKLSVVNTGNAGTPVKEAGQHPILTVDVWEHALKRCDSRDCRRHEGGKWGRQVGK
eukprot:g15366.t1